MSESEKKILTEEELERKKKKEEKAKEKELKKQKALEKERLAELKAKQAKDGTNVPKKSAKKSSKRDASEENPEDFVDPETPLGERKRLSSQMAKQYSPATVEKSWYAWWEKSDLFKADAKSSKPPFVIVLPPPNVTGALHIGHALTSAIEDTIIRWKRMSGYNALWVPGVDHAGIATQVVVEKKIMRDRGMTRHDVGREEFVKEVWKWKNQYGGTILTQLRRLGASLDWSRECFTMDEQRSKAVTEAFVRLYKEGLIYRDIRLVNWDCILRTAISDVEVEYIDIKEKTLLKVPGYEKPVEFGLLTSFAYPLEGGLGEVIVATTRVETMLGDTAIAIHPDDARYKHLHGKFAVHPFNGRKLPIICDGILVDPNFGTGCVKITPAHDPNDCEVGKRHKLEFINIFTDDGKINTNGGSDFAGMPRFAAREAVVEALQKQGLYRGAKNNEMRLGLCSRTNDVIEPMIKPQWYVNCSMIGKEALDVAITDENKKLEFVPKQYTAEWRRWLENIRDWCISRQLWWGHRIPAWYATLEEDQLKEVGAYSDHWVVARTEDDAREEAAQKFLGKKFELTRDPDVLDTWFSSGLFPLSVLGWPDVTDDFKAFYPTSVLETGHDILFFWVARMVMMGMKLGGEVPFSKVYFHPMIRDAHGRKMSKSLGNVIDPLEVINGVTLEGLHKRLEEGNLDPKEVIVAKEGQVKDFPNGIPECGTDALRFALVSYTAQSDKINLDILRVVGYRQWCNKLWNAVRFAMMKLGDGYTPPQTLSPETMPFSCQWILSVLNKAISKTVVSLDAFEFSDAANTIYAWWQYQFCDVYIEAIKPYFAGDNPTFASERAHAQHALWISLETGLRLLHPFMPFVTEELWQRLPAPKDTERKASIMICDYPSAIENWSNEKVESEMDTVLATVKCMRALRISKVENTSFSHTHYLFLYYHHSFITETHQKIKRETFHSGERAQVLMANLVLSECGIRPLPRIYTTPRSNFLSNNNKFRPSLSSSSYKTSSSPLSFGLNSRDGFTRNWALNVSTPLTTPIFEESPLEEDNKQRFDPGAPPPFNLADIRAAIPKHCWVKNPWKSLSYVVRDVAIVFALAAGAAYLNNWIVWPLYWLAQGTMFWALFVLGHDCGHGSFSNDPKLNSVVGHLLHSSILVPYHGWRISHRTHHQNHGHVENDESWHPMSEKIYNTLDKPTRFFRFTLPLVMLAYPFYLWARSPGKKGSHYHPDSDLFLPKERKDVLTSTACWTAMAALLVCLNFTIGPIQMLKLYGIPYWINVMWLDFVTYLHHHGHEDKLPWYRGKEWSYLRGGLTTLDRDYGLINNIHHDIGTHVIHHLFPQIPHYHLVEATEAAKPVLGKYYREPDKSGPLPLHLLEILAKSIKEDHYVSDEGEVVYYKADPNLYGEVKVRAD